MANARCEILAIGTELTTGQSLDTNSRWLSRRLSATGIPVAFHTTVGDDLDDNLDAFRTALGRADLVLVTGGLGPTADDLTRDVLAKAAGVGLVLHEESLRAIEGLFRQRSRQMPERNRVQAYLPEGAVGIPNPNGTAPGIWLGVAGALVVCLPGVPKEMFAMFDDWALPRILERFGGGTAIVERAVHCYGAGEANVEEMLGDLIRRDRNPLVGITASEATISLRIIATAPMPEEARRLADSDEQFIRQRLGDLVFGADGEELQTAVAALLRGNDRTLATAESCTGGLVGHLLTEVPGISRHYLGGVVSYSNESKQALLDVPAKLLEAHGAVSQEVATVMAEGVRRRFGADLGLGVTGVAGPGGGTPEKPVGLVYVALAHAKGVALSRYNWLADRSSTKLRSAKTALNLIRLHLLRG